MRIQVVAHTSYCGQTGYNAHSQSFFSTLNKHVPVRIRNYTYTPEFSDIERETLHLLIEQPWQDPPFKIGSPFHKTPDDLIVNLVLNESHHYYFYDNYSSPLIFYNVWESTKQRQEFFNRMLEADQFWCPTEWQRQCTIDQGYPEERVKVVPEGVNGNIFRPGNDVDVKRELLSTYNIPQDAFVFMIFGRWDYRKSIKEMVQAWYNSFRKKDNCYLVISVDNPFSVDGMHSTEERLKYYKLEHERIKILHFPPRPEYINWLQYGSCLLSCSRSEGWNLPLMESLACGTPSICSDWGGHLEFANGIAYKVNVPKELPPKEVFMVKGEHDLGVWGEPDFDHLETVMKTVYSDYNAAKNITLELSRGLRKKYTWENAAQKANRYINSLVKSNIYPMVTKDGNFKVSFSLSENKSPKITFTSLLSHNTIYTRIRNLSDTILYETKFTDVKKNINYWLTWNYPQDTLEGIKFEILDENLKMLHSCQKLYAPISSNKNKPRDISRKIIEHKIEFVWNEDEVINAEGKIIDGYTGLSFYRCTFSLKKGTTYWFQHSPVYGPQIKSTIFQLINMDTNEILFSDNTNEGPVDLATCDPEGHIRDYHKIMPWDYTVGLPLYEIFVDDIYKQNLCTISKGDVVVDIGANAGFFSLYAYYQGCKVCYAFEPIKSIYNATKEQLKNVPNLILENKAVDNFTGTTEIYIPNGESIGASLYDPFEKYKKPQSVESCDVISFMDMINEKQIEKVDYLKLDCEGSEYNIINSIPDDYLKNNIKKIAIEYHNNTNNGSLKEILDRLDKLGFEIDFRDGSNINSDLGIVCLWKKFNFDEFMAPYKESLKRTGEHRYHFYKYVIQKLISKRKPLYIIETGTMWSGIEDNMGAFTYIIGDLIKNWTGGKLVTIDISEDNINKCKETTKKFKDIIEYVNSDSITYLKSLSNGEVSQVDLFYFDSYDLNATNQDPSAHHHLQEVKAVYDRLNTDVILGVDDNFLPGTEIQWNWFGSDGKISHSEIVKTGNKIIGKGSLVNEFLLERGWNRIKDYDVVGESHVFFYEREKTIKKEIVSEILNRFYQRHQVTKQKGEPFNYKGITNPLRGLGDTMVLTPFTEFVFIDSYAPTFPGVMFFNKDYKNPRFYGNFEKEEFIDISLFPKYNWGGGHAIQRISRALGLPEIVKPKGKLDIQKKEIKGRIGYHLNRLKEKRKHCLTEAEKECFYNFMNSTTYEFIDLSVIDNIRELVETMTTCEFFIGINSGPMHVAAALDIKSIIIVKYPHISELYLPRLCDVDIPEGEWLYPQNVHLHVNDSNELVPIFNKENLKNAIEGYTYPFWNDTYLDINLNSNSNERYNININYINGPFVEIKGFSNSSFKVEFIDYKTKDIIHTSNIQTNQWTKANRRYYTDWLIKIYKDDILIKEEKLNLKDSRVYIHLDSKSIGDTIAWFPYIEEFRKVHSCKMICSTFWNHLFTPHYPDIEFVTPGTGVDNIFAMYTLGWWDKDKDQTHLRPSNPRIKPLQQTSSDILGIPYREILPKIYIKDKTRKIKEKYVCIATISTAGCKLWLRPNGWQDVIDYLNELGYKVVVVQKEPTDLKNIIDRTGKEDLQESINLIYHADFFIGLASGLSWVAWALEKKSIMIAGFTDTYTEYQHNCYRVINKNVCNGCWNDPEAFPFDRSWNWCPRNKDFECSKNITFQMVKDNINHLLID